MSALAPAMRLRVSEIAVWVRSMIRSISSLVLCMLAVVVRTRVRGLWNGINMLPSGIMRRERIVGSLSRHGHLKQMPMRQINTHVAAALRDSRPLVPFLSDGSIAHGTARPRRATAVLDQLRALTGNTATRKTRLCGD